MTLYEWLSVRQVSRTKMAADLNISLSALYKYINFEREPTLSIAIAIYKYTRGKVGFEDMLKSNNDLDLEYPDEDLL